MSDTHEAGAVPVPEPAAAPVPESEPATAAEPAPVAAPTAASLPVPAELKAACEAILIVSDDAVTEGDLAAALGISEELAIQLLESLAVEYEDPERPRGFVLRKIAGGWRFASAPRFDDLLRDFVIAGATARLSRAALETLAVIAYRQPITRSRIAAIRGVNVDGVVRTLHARGLIEQVGNESTGALLYRTTPAFLEYVGLDSLDELPPLAPYLPDSSALGDIEEEAVERSQR